MLFLFFLNLTQFNISNQGHLTTKSDVYGYGVVLLELITGRRSIDRTRPSREQSLVEWARPCIKDPRKLDKIIDPRLEGLFSTKGAQKAAALAYKCLSHQPKCRPTMTNVVTILEALQDFNDWFVEPFVYVAPTENPSNEHSVKEKGIQSEGEKYGNEENGLHCHNDNVWRPLVTYSDTSLYTRFRNGF